MSKKRTRDGAMAHNSQEQPSSPFVPMFEGFKKELDEHHDRRERVVKASRDITAASKKIIFSLQRVRNLGEKVPPFVTKNNSEHWKTIGDRYKSVSPDLQGLNAYRYVNITWGNQEFMEALSFQHYLETQTLISYDEAKEKVSSLSGEGDDVFLSPEDYILGIFDMVGELMRFSITSMATNGKIPVGKSIHKNPPSDSAFVQAEDGTADKMDVGEPEPALKEQAIPRDVLADLRELRLQLEMFEPPPGSRFSSDVEKKMIVMRECVEKVEKALYSLTVRGQERPKGWMPDVRESRRGSEIESH